MNINSRKCSCRKWELTGIPCCHAVACLWHNNYKPENYVVDWYKYVYFGISMLSYNAMHILY